MITYSIQYEQRTGDSGGSENKTDELELTWKDKEVAKANLKRINDHWLYYQALDKFPRIQYHSKKEQLEVKKIMEEAPNQDWFVKPDKKNQFESCLILKTDAGKDWQFQAPWCGYFNSLLKIKLKENEEGLSYRYD